MPLWRKTTRPDPEPLDVPRDEPTMVLEDVPAMIVRARQAGHDITVVDLVDELLPGPVRRHASLVLEASVDALLRRARTPQRLRLRIRIDDGDLALSMQSLGGSVGDQGIRLTADDMALLRARVEAASGRMTVRPTPTGNWVAVAFLPLQPPV